MTQVELEINLSGNLSGASKNMQKDLQSLQAELRAEKAALSDLEGALKAVSSASVVDLGVTRQLSASIASKKDSVAGLTGELSRMGGVGRKASQGAESLGESFLGAAQGAASSESAISSLGASVGGLVNPYALAASAVAALGAAFAYAVGKGISLSLSAAQAKNDVEDSLSIILDTQESVDETYDRLNDISDSLGVGAESTQRVAESLALAGITSKDSLLDAVNAVQTAAKLSESAGAKIQGVIEKAGASGKFELGSKSLKGAGVSQADVIEQLHQQTGKSVKALTDDLKKGKISAEAGVAALTKAVDVKLGAKALEKGRGFDESVQRIRNSLTRVFEQVNIGPLEDALSRVADLLRDASAEGGFLQTTLVPVFDKVFDVLGRLVTGARAGLLLLEIAFLQVYIAAKPLRDAWEKAFPSDATDSVDVFSDSVVDLGGVLVFTLAAGLVIVAGAMAAVAVSVALAAVPFVILGAAVAAVGYAIYEFVSDVWDLVSALGGLVASAAEAGGNLVNGLVDGVVAAGPKLVESLMGVGRDAIQSFKSLFKIHSPSLVMGEMGENISLGLVKGVEGVDAPARLSAVADESLEAMGRDPGAGAPPPALARTVSEAAPASQAGERGPQGGRASVDLSGMRIEIVGVKGAEQVPDLLMTVFADLMERASLLLGSRPEGSA